MNFRAKLLLVSILPTFLISLAALVLINLQAGDLAREQGTAVAQMILKSKEVELKNYVKLARSAIGPFYDSDDAGTNGAKQQVAKVLNQMTFGQDGYFFVYKEDGTNIVHPRLPELVGHNWIELEDPNGKKVIRDLIDLAKNGGEYYRYVWNKPSTGQDAEKLGYSIFLDRWGWMLGSGLYVDDIAAQIVAMEKQLDENLQQTRWVLLALSAGAILLTGFLVSAIRLSEQKLADERLKELARRVVDAQENERKRVSTELHDGISQLLVSARYGLDAALSHAQDNAKVARPVDSAMKAISNAIGEIRRISMALRPSVLDDMGLVTALKSLGRDFERQTGIRTVIRATELAIELNDREKTALYRVTQEALANIAKHSNATNCRIGLEMGNATLTLQVTDNGRGIPAGKGKHKDPFAVEGLGLGNMRERIESLSGKLQLFNVNDGGLTVSVKLPIDYRKRAGRQTRDNAGARPPHPQVQVSDG